MLFRWPNGSHWLVCVYNRGCRVDRFKRYCHKNRNDRRFDCLPADFGLKRPNHSLFQELHLARLKISSPIKKTKSKDQVRSVYYIPSVYPYSCSIA